MPDQEKTTKIENFLPKFTAFAKPDEIVKELENLSSLIKTMKNEISQIESSEIVSFHLPTAHDELDAVIEATGQATHSILQAAEDIDAYTKHLPDKFREIMQRYTVRIYEACTFQDITGQRINKVICTLKVLEHNISQLIEATTLNQKENQDKEKLNSLLNGPSSKGKAPTQQEIDAIFEQP
jgi:chemotaxis protein CheZ